MNGTNTAALLNLQKHAAAQASPWKRAFLSVFSTRSGRYWLLWDVYAGIIAAWSAFNLTPYGWQPHGLAVGVFFGLVLGLSAWVCGVPRPETNASRYELLSVSAIAVLLTLVLCISAGILIAYAKIGRWIWVLFGLLAYVAVTVPRLIVGKLETRVKHRALIYGAGRVGQAVARDIGSETGLQIAGFLDDDRRLWHRSIDGIPCLGGLKQAETVCRQADIQVVSVAVGCALKESKTLGLLRLRHVGVEIMDIPELYERFMARIPIDYIDTQWLLSGPRLSKTAINRLNKRLLDAVCSVSGLILSLPLWPLIALAVKAESRGPVFFRQWRMGYNKRPFRLIKFRTMVTGAEADGAQWAAEHDARITRVGRLLRLTRLDELPQLINVCLGQMSMVGPRPERPELIVDIEKKMPLYDQRYLVPPGITGWAQVKYRYGATLEDTKRKLEYDLYYIQNISFRLDLQILLQTGVMLMKGSR